MPVKPVVEWQCPVTRWLGYLVLWPATLLFGVFLVVRDFLRQNRCVKKPASSERPFILVVGSIAVGGSGKTPVVEFLARALNKRNHRVCILNHGYKKKKTGIVQAYDGVMIQSTPDEAGDESVMLAESLSVKKLPIPVIAAEKRNDAIQWIRTKWDPDIIVLDDGLQDDSITPDFTIGVMDHDELKYPQLPLPIGRLRDRLQRLKRCDVTVMTKCTRSQTNSQNHGNPLVWTPVCLVNIADRSHHPLDLVKNQRVLAFAGIGHFQPFRRLVKDIGHDAEEIHFTEFADHHAYGRDDIRQLASRRDLTVFLTTHKDAVKIAELELTPSLRDKMFYLDIRIEGGAGLVAALEAVLSQRHLIQSKRPQI